MALTAQQQLFVSELLKDPARNRTQAAIRAGYSPKTAVSQGSRLSRNAEIAAALDSKLVKVLDKLDIKTGDVLAELGRIGFADIKEVFDEAGVIRHPRDFPEDIRRCVKSFEQEELLSEPDPDGGERFKIGRTVKISFWDKPKGLELLGKNQKLFTDKVEHEVGMSLEALILASMAKGLP